MSEKDAEELLQSSQTERRHTTETESDSESETDTDTDTDERTLEDEIAAQLEAVEQGDLHPNLTLRDGDLAALVKALDEQDELDAVLARAYDALDRPAPDEATKAEVLRALIRLGLQDVAQDELDAAHDAKRRSTQF